MVIKICKCIYSAYLNTGKTTTYLQKINYFLILSYFPDSKPFQDIGALDAW